MSYIWPPKLEKKLVKWAKSKTLDQEKICSDVGKSWTAVERKLGRMGLWDSVRSRLRTDQREKPVDSADVRKQEAEIARLNIQLSEMAKRTEIIPHNFFDKVVRVGLVTDTHFGSLFERPDVLDAAYKTFKREGITTVYHAGDMCDGERMFRGHEYEIRVHGGDGQVSHCVDTYSYEKGIDTYFITGSHDLSFWKHAGVNIGEKIGNQRADLHHLGDEEVDVAIGEGERQIILRLVHPGKGTAYALSYHPQKYIESLSGGQKPHIIFMGHYHKAEMMPCYRNIFVVQGGCIESQTGFMRRNNLAAHMGFWIIEFTVNPPNLVSRFKPEFFAVYEERKFKSM